MDDVFFRAWVKWHLVPGLVLAVAAYVALAGMLVVDWWRERKRNARSAKSP